MKHYACICTSTICCSTMPLSIKLVWLGNMVVEFVQFAQSSCCWPKLLLELHHFRLLDTSRWLAISHHSHFHSLFVSFWLLTTIVIRDRVASWWRWIEKNWVFLVRWVVLDFHRPSVDCRLLETGFPLCFCFRARVKPNWSWILHPVNGAGACGNNYECNENQSKSRGIIYNADALNRTKQLCSKPRTLFLSLDGCSVAQEHQVYVGLAEQYLQKTRGGSSCSNASLIEWLVSRSVSPLSDLY